MKPLSIPEVTGNDTINIALDTIKIGRQALVFLNTKQSAEKCAEEIARKIKTDNKKLAELSLSVLKALSRPTKQCERLSRCINRGIAFHHAGLTHEQRTAVEDNFRNGLIKIICCTPTLAYGVDLPAYRAIIRDLKRFGARGMQWIPVLEYLQIAGRAGRPKFDKEGQAIVVASTKPEKKAIYNRYVLGEPEDIYSKLAVEPVLRTYLLSLISTNFVSTKTEIASFFSKTFWAHQFRDMEQLKEIIDKMLQLLEEWEFIKTDDEEFVSANNLNKEINIRATILGKRVAELYIDPLTAHQLIKGLREATAKQTDAFSYLQLVSSTLEMRPLLRVKTKEFDDFQEKLAETESQLLQKEPSIYDSEYDYFISSIKTACFFNEWIDEKNENELLETFNIRPGEIRVKLDNANWLLYACQELSRIMRFKKIAADVMKTRLRVKYGAKEELFPLLKLKNIGRVRARRLFNSGIKDIREIKKADMLRLADVVGSKTAADIKRQVGEEIKEDKKINLTDY